MPRPPGPRMVLRGPNLGGIMEGSSGVRPSDTVSSIILITSSCASESDFCTPPTLVKPLCWCSSVTAAVHRFHMYVFALTS